VRSFLDYSLFLWKYQCTLVHGQTLEESKNLTLQRLQLKVTEAYQTYREDSHTIPQKVRHIFSISLESFLKQDIDSLEYFLSTFQIACEIQCLNQLILAQRARTFFQPKTQVVTQPAPQPLERGCH
jgi:hypothetical protein